MIFNMSTLNLKIDLRKPLELNILYGCNFSNTLKQPLVIITLRDSYLCSLSTNEYVSLFKKCAGKMCQHIPEVMVTISHFVTVG